MPTSNLALAPLLLHMVEEVPHARILDVGPGYGKYGLLLREYLNEKPEQVDAVEADSTYLRDFPWLWKIYDNVYNLDILNWKGHFSERWLPTYDVVFMVEVIEHMDKQAALELIDQIPGRIVICTPEKFFHQHVDGHPWERHVSHWTRADFEGRAERLDLYLGGVVARLGPKGD